MSPLVLFLTFWTVWSLSWLAASFWASAPTLSLGGPSVWLYRGLLTAGVALLLAGPLRWIRAPELWPVSRDLAYGLALATIPGFAFAWWARLHLGRLWSSAVTQKPGHRVVDTGPYGIVRHPIYTGLLWASLVSAAAGGRWTALAGFAAMAVGFWVKARLEEGLLSRQLGPDAYAAYRWRVPMLVPFWPHRPA